MGSTLKAYIQQQEAAKGVGGEATFRADWGEVDPTLIVNLLVAVSRAGGAVLYGASRSGDLFSIQIFVEGEKHSKFWHCHSDYEKMVTWMEAMTGAAGEMAL